MRKLTRQQIRKLSKEDLEAAARAMLLQQQEHRKRNAIQYYEPVSKQAAAVHQDCNRLIGVSGGNGSSKTETMVAETVALMTGVMPEKLRKDPVFRSKFKGPIQVRMVVESLTNTLYPIILPKFQWYKWTGISEPGGSMGHWGWVPQNCLKQGKWDKSFSKELRMLTVYCRDPDHPERILGESVLTFMSKDNDAEDFASGDFDHILMDEPPLEAQFRECQARTMRKNGRVVLMMTWPDDPTIPVAWIHDEVYEPAKRGDPDTSWHELDTRDNKHLIQESIQAQMRRWSKEMIAVRIHGKPIRFSHRVHPLFSKNEAWWCFDCNATTMLAVEAGDQLCTNIAKEDDERGKLRTCKSRNIVQFSHVADEPIPASWPVVFLMDPHPRKPHVMSWIVVRPDESYYQIAEAECDEDEEAIIETVRKVERDHRLHITKRLVDPNMGLSPSGRKRHLNWQDLLYSVGLNCDLPDDSSAGRKVINGFMKPDRDTMMPRFCIHPRCELSIKQFDRYAWDNYKIGTEKGLKEVPKPIDDDHPALWKYFANEVASGQVSFRMLHNGPMVIRRRAS